LAEHNVLYDVRGAGIYIENGNEMYNRIQYNAYICPWQSGVAPKFGCSQAGTDNGDGDTSDNQAGFFAFGTLTFMIGNRFANSFNGMFYSLGTGSQVAYNKVWPYHTGVGRLAGNTFHDHNRFGTYILYNYPKNCNPDLNGDGYVNNLTYCDAFTSAGEDNGFPVMVYDNFDYSNVFVAGYNVGDVQYYRHFSFDNANLIYWKETKDFQDGCSAHLSNSFYHGGNLALPGGQGAFIIENVTFTGPTKFEATHHCNEGVTGGLCMPTYVLSNVKFDVLGLQYWITWSAKANGEGWSFDVLFLCFNTSASQEVFLFWRLQKNQIQLEMEDSSLQDIAVLFRTILTHGF
jgi:hypothetical protein